MYHDVRDLNRSRFPRRYGLKSFIGTQEFDRQLDYISHHYAVITIEHFLAAVKGTTDLPFNPAILTFDDGLRDHHSEVLRRLRARKFTGAFSFQLAH